MYLRNLVACAACALLLCPKILRTQQQSLDSNDAKTVGSEIVRQWGLRLLDMGSEVVRIAHPGLFGLVQGEHSRAQSTSLS